MSDQPQKPPPVTETRSGLSSREGYNVVTDTVTGVNVRWRDNVIQGVVIAFATLAGFLAGWLIAEEKQSGALLGALAGLVGGTLLSGVGLMIYRGVRHLKGRHD